MAGRVYQAMTPTFTLDAILTPDEAAIWRRKVTPARESDLFGG